MNQLKIDDNVYNLLIAQLLEKKHICFIGNSKCGKSRVAEELIKRLEGTYSKPKIVYLQRITGVSKGIKYIYPGLDKPLLLLKNASGMPLISLEDMAEDYYIISTFPVPTLDLLFNRFIAFDNNHLSMKDYRERLWRCIPVVAENKKLSDGNVYIMSIYSTIYKYGILEKDILCRFSQNTSLCEGEFSRVSGKYSIETEMLT